MPKKIESFEDLLVWQKGMNLVKRVYLITRDGKMSKNFIGMLLIIRMEFRAKLYLSAKIAF